MRFVVIASIMNDDWAKTPIPIPPKRPGISGLSEHRCRPARSDKVVVCAGNNRLPPKEFASDDLALKSSAGVHLNQP